MLLKIKENAKKAGMAGAVAAVSGDIVLESGKKRGYLNPSRHIGITGPTGPAKALMSIYKVFRAIQCSWDQN
jgi:hypothetical protein